MSEVVYFLQYLTIRVFIYICVMLPPKILHIKIVFASNQNQLRLVNHVNIAVFTHNRIDCTTFKAQFDPSMLYFDRSQ